MPRDKRQEDMRRRYVTPVTGQTPGSQRWFSCLEVHTHTLKGGIDEGIIEMVHPHDADSCAEDSGCCVR